MVVSDQSVWHTVQLQPEAPWLPWVPLGLPGGDNGGTVGPLAGAFNADGGLDLFTIDTGDTVRLRQQLMPSQDFSDWESLGSPAAGLDGTGLGVTRISDGRLELFMAASDGGVWHRWQNKGGPGWAAWAPLGQPSQGGHQHQLADLAVAQDRASGLILYATEPIMAPPRPDLPGCGCGPSGPKALRGSSETSSGSRPAPPPGNWTGRC